MLIGILQSVVILTVGFLVLLFLVCWVILVIDGEMTGSAAVRVVFDYASVIFRRMIQ